MYLYHNVIILQKNSIVNLFLEGFWAVSFSLFSLFHFVFIFSLTVDSVCPPILSLTTLILNVFHYWIVQERYEAYSIKGKRKGISLVVGWLGLCLPMWGPRVQFLVEELGSYMLHSQETKTWSGSNIEEIQLRPGKKKRKQKWVIQIYVMGSVDLIHMYCYQKSYWIPVLAMNFIRNH